MLILPRVIDETNLFSGYLWTMISPCVNSMARKVHIVEHREVLDANNNPHLDIGYFKTGGRTQNGQHYKAMTCELEPHSYAHRIQIGQLIKHRRCTVVYTNVVFEMEKISNVNIEAVESNDFNKQHDRNATNAKIK